jgi:alpha-beta hydrolase superfamily lysophospholipase
MNPANGSVPAIGIEVRIDKGTTLPGRAWCAERPRAIVAIVHGLGEHSGRYAALAAELVTRARCTVVSLDLPGHGEAPGPRGDMPSWALVRDRVIPAMFTATRGLPDQPFSLPQVLLGHSMGGVLALDCALAHGRDLHALVLSSPAVRTAMPPWWKLAAANIARAAAPATGFPSGLDVSGITRDPEALQRYRDDPRVHDRISPRLYFAFNEAAQRCLRDVRQLSVPTLLLQGMADRVVDPKGALELAGSAAHGVMRFVTLADRYHETFNDLGRDDVVRDLVAWLDAAIVV